MTKREVKNVAEYYTKLESDARYATSTHTHNLEDLGGTGIGIGMVLMPEDVTVITPFYGNAYDLYDVFLNIKTRFEGLPTFGGAASKNVGTTAGTVAAGDHTHTGYAAATHSHAQADITGLSDALDEKAAANHTHNYAAAVHGHQTSDISGLAELLAGKAAATHSHSYNDLTDRPTIPVIPDSLPANGGNADTVGGKSASDFAAAEHTHDGDYIKKSLQMTSDNGSVEYFYGTGSNKSLLTEMASWGTGLHTAYSIGTTEGNPTPYESWRILCHKTSNVIGWVLAFGTSGSIYANYYDNGWRGWKAIYDALPKPLWTGGYYMTGSQTVTPSKKLSECAHGWILLWSDYDPDTSTVNEKDYCTTMIPSRTPTGAKWSSKLFYCDLPRYIGDNLSDMSTEKRCIKQIYISDDKIVGHNSNSQGERNDLVLRAVF